MWEGGLRIPMIVAGPGVSANSQCDQPVAQWDYLPTIHDLAGSTAALPSDLDGISLRPVFEHGNDGKLAPRDTGFVFHFPAHYTVPITAFRSGDFKLMRHLNSGEIKLFNVVKDMGETNDLTKQMPEKTAEMVRQLDAYLQKVGAWTMDEVYATRTEELEKWTATYQAKVDQLNQQLSETGLSQEDHLELSKKLEESTAKIKHCEENLEKLNLDRNSNLWF